ncbi:hypothetical protein FG379_001798 [Cryptosporidium bovis]|uniref:uncharacterized protein n=1 Tax=Cryptosporidium bovis TaxID=310047 RepID=UPI003519F417|nr:hypothetical protein FG379_001798 [Cryptosporidium bovis]
MSKLTNGVKINPVKLSMIERINAFEKKTNANCLPPKLFVSTNKVIVIDRKGASMDSEEKTKGSEASSKENIEFKDENLGSRHLPVNSLKRQDHHVASDSDSDTDRARKMEEAMKIAEELMNSQLRKINIESDLRTIETRYPTRVNSPRYYTEKKEVMDKANKLLNSYSLPSLWENRFKWFNCVENVLTMCNDDEIVHNQPQYDDKQTSSSQIRKNSLSSSSSKNREKYVNVNSSLNFSSEFDSCSRPCGSGGGIVKTKSKLFSGISNKLATRNEVNGGTTKSESEASVVNVDEKSPFHVKKVKKLTINKSNDELASSGNNVNTGGSKILEAISKLNKTSKKNPTAKENGIEEKGVTRASTVTKNEQVKQINTTNASKIDTNKAKESRKSTNNDFKTISSYQDDIYCFDDGAGYLTFGINNNNSKISEKKETKLTKKTAVHTSNNENGDISKLATKKSSSSPSFSDKKVESGNTTMPSVSSKKDKNVAEITNNNKKEYKKLENINSIPSDSKDSLRDSFPKFEKKDENKIDEGTNIVIGGGANLFITRNTRKSDGVSNCDKSTMLSLNSNNSSKMGRKKALREGKSKETNVSANESSSLSSSVSASTSESRSTSINYSSNFIRGRMDYISTDVFV